MIGQVYRVVCPQTHHNRSNHMTLSPYDSNVNTTKRCVSTHSHTKVRTRVRTGRDGQVRAGSYREEGERDREERGRGRDGELWVEQGSMRSRR